MPVATGNVATLKVANCPFELITRNIWPVPYSPEPILKVITMLLEVNDTTVCAILLIVTLGLMNPNPVIVELDVFCNNETEFT